MRPSPHYLAAQLFNTSLPAPKRVLKRRYTYIRPSWLGSRDHRAQPALATLDSIPCPRASQPDGTNRFRATMHLSRRCRRCTCCPGDRSRTPSTARTKPGPGPTSAQATQAPRRSLDKSLSIDAFTSSSRLITRRDEVRWGRPPPSHPTLLSVGDENGVQTP